MATEKQIQANRDNAKNSTGPRTDEGKAASSQNARKHGLLARDAVIPGEDPAEFEAQLAALEDAIQPGDALEHELVRQIADAQWRMQRLARLETAYLNAAVQKSRRHAKLWELAEYLRPGPDGETLLLGYSMHGSTQGLLHLSRYDAHLGRRFERALQQIAKLRESREKRPQPSPKSASRASTASPDSTAPALQEDAQTPPSEICETNPIPPNQNGINKIASTDPAQLHPARPKTERNAPQPNGADQITSVNGAASPPNPLLR